MRPQLGRRALPAALAAAWPASSGPAWSKGTDRTRQWLDYKARFLEPSGRIVDTGNGRVSHTEGQGWALLFAAAFDDRPAFDRVLAWTRQTLRRRTDLLFSWRYRPGAHPAVDDPNNATDGDLYIAWALLRAGERWGDRTLHVAGTALARDILGLLRREVAGRAVLLPGVQGFETGAELTLNPSYLVFPAYAALARATADPRWGRLAADGLDLLRKARFGRWGLPPDWLTVRRADGALALPARWPPRFSFDAVRVPLLLAWGGYGREPAVAAAAGFWGDPARADLPAWTDLVSNALAPFSASEGVRGIASLAAAVTVPGPARPVALREVRAASDYYSASLLLLARLAAEELSLPVSSG
jgi:endoglucanase